MNQNNSGSWLLVIVVVALLALLLLPDTMMTTVPYLAEVDALFQGNPASATPTPIVAKGNGWTGGNGNFVAASEAVAATVFETPMAETNWWYRPDGECGVITSGENWPKIGKNIRFYTLTVDGHFLETGEQPAISLLCGPVKEKRGIREVQFGLVEAHLQGKDPPGYCDRRPLDQNLSVAFSRDAQGTPTFERLLFSPVAVA